MAELTLALCLGGLGLLGALVVLVLAGCLDVAARLDDEDERRYGIRRS